MASTFESSPLVSQESQLIERQLDVTRSNVRMVELGAAAVAWLACVLLYLLAVAVVDHWILPLGTAGRFLALALLVGGSVGFGALILWPLLRREINPVYAARTIEESVPSLKNSLVNFLLLRKDPNQVKAAVLSAVEQRAAIDIATVPVDLAVDRSKVIRLGYVLLAIVSIFALYKIRSPKDPFQTMARVFAPWANIDRPARVAISEIEPGDTQVYHGKTVMVRCVVLGLRPQETVKVVFSSLDGQTMEKSVPLQPSAVGTRFEAEIPPRDSLDRGAIGVQQDLVYRIVAGDQVSRDYQIKVTTAPTMVVERVTYDFKPYTKKPPQIVEGQGDLQALEGTRVTINARANQPIETGFLELDPAADGKTAAAERIPLIVDGTTARAAITLQLKPDRQTPWRTSYQLRFVTKGGERNDQAIMHRIDVTPDLPPEIEWLTPERTRVDVPQDGQQLLELRAVDPDFGLKAIKLTATRGDVKLFERNLLSTPTPQPQATVRFEFKPAELMLDEGDEVVVWGTAEDGRVAPLSDAADPNRAKSPLLTLKITAPAKPAANSPQPNTANKPNDPQQQPRIQPMEKPGDKPGPKSPSPENPSNEPQKDPMKDPMKNENSSQNAGKKEEGGNKSESPMKGEEGNEGEQQGGKGGEQGGSGGNQQEKKEGEQGGGGSQAGSKNNAGSKGGNEKGGSSSDDGGEEGDNSGAASGAGKKGGKGGQGDKEQTGGGEPGDSENSPGGSNSSSSGEGSENGQPHDGEVFDKVLEQLKKNGKEPKSGSQGKAAGERPAGDQSGGGGKTEDQGAQKSPQPNGGKSADSSNSGDKGNGSQPNSNNDNSGKNSKPGEKTESGKPEGNGGEPKKEGAAGDKPKQSDTPKPGETTKPGDSPKPGDSTNDNSAGNPTPNPNGSSPDKGSQPKGTKPGDPRPGDRPADQAPDKTDPNQTGKKPGLDDKNLGAGNAQKPNPGEGGAPQKNSQTPKDGPKPNPAGNDDGKPKDPGAGDAGTSGAGANSKDPMGSGPAEQANRDKPKSQSPDGQQADAGEPSPPGQGKKHSDSKGGAEGDRSGGGKQGSGQPGKQAGNDSPGSKSAADQGAGQANEPGKGEAGTKGGTQEKTDQKTGTAGNDPGQGSSSKENAGGKNNEGKSNEPGEGTASDRQPNSENGGAGSGKGKKGEVVAGGAQGSGDSSTPRPEGSVPDGDEANLKYAQQATDLVIDHLKDQEHNPDPALLKQLGWTKDDLSAFLRRWESLKQGAETPAAKRQLEESLRSLGLKAPKENKRSGGSVNDKVRDLQDAGGRSAPPNRYRDQFDAFRKGVGRPAGTTP